MRTFDTMYRPAIQGPRGFGYPGQSHTGSRHVRNLPDVTTGISKGWRFGGGFFKRDKGFGIDLNGNGRFDRGRDGVLAFDLNRDGKISKNEVSGTNNMMKAASGDFDFNGDGKVSKKERWMGAIYRKKFGKLDRNGDGRLSSGEIASGGGRIWVDRNRDGKVGRGETHSPFRVPGGFFQGSKRVDVGTNGWSRVTDNRRLPRFPQFPQYPRQYPPQITAYSGR